MDMIAESDGASKIGHDAKDLDNIKVEDMEKALEKQKPKKPIMIEGYIYGVCPSCHNILEVGRYCGNCGQAIDHLSRFGQRFDNEQGE